MKVNFDETLAELKPIMMGKAQQAMAHADAQDLVSDYSVRIWRICLEKDDFKSKDHARAYFLRKFKYKIIDFLRYRERRNKLVEVYQNVHPRFSPSSVEGRMGIGDAKEIASSMGGVYFQVLCLMLVGYTYREIASELGLGTATVGRYVANLMRQISSGRRVSDDDTERTHPTKEDKMGYLCKRKNRQVLVAESETKVVVAKATLNSDCTAIDSIELRKGYKAKGGVITRAIGEFMNFTVTEEEDVAKKKTAKKSAPKAKTGGKLPPPKKPLDWDTVKKMPATVAGLVKLVGEGYCMGGSGKPVARRFKPGYDAKLKSVLKKKGTKEAKALAKELGWFKIIKWEKK